MKKTASFALALLCPFIASAEIYIPEVIPYHDPARIDYRITSECTKLGENFSLAVAKYAEKRGIKVVRTTQDLSQFPNRAEISIESAMSAGNAFTGHAKGIVAYGQLYNNNQQVNQTTFSRSSTGGFMGGFKGSCTVLNRTVNTLGSDVSKWLQANQQP